MSREANGTELSNGNSRGRKSWKQRRTPDQTVDSTQPTGLSTDMSKKFFRPPPQAMDDSDSEEDEEELLDDDAEVDDEDVTEVSPPNKSKPTNNANLSESDDDDDEPDERPPKRKGRHIDNNGNADARSSNKRAKPTSFFELEAEASDSEDDDADDAAKQLHKDSEQMDEEAREIIRQQDRRRAQAGGRFDRSVAEISADIENRHRAQRRVVDRHRIREPAFAPPPSKQKSLPRPGNKVRSQRPPMDRDDEDDFDDGGAPPDATPEGYTAVAQQSLVPSVSDPSMWMVSCANGKEHELVCQIMNKCVAMARQGRPVGISSAIAAQSKGKIYLESFSEPAVVDAIQGVRGLLQYTMRLVPIGDMTTVMTVTSRKKPVQKNEWVRMTRGHYKHDLALVKDVKESGLKCVVQCVPRLDLTLADLPPAEARMRRKTVRPPQKFFNPQEIAALGRHGLTRQRFPGLNLYCDYFDGNYYHDGYLLKEMTVGSMIKACTDEDPPTLDELQRFQRRQSKQNEEDGGDENEGSKMAASLLDELSDLQGRTGLGKTKTGGGGGLLIGDTIEVIEGDLIGMRGKLVSLDGTTVKVKPINANVDLGGTDEIEFLGNQLRKYIPVGAHVKVTDGRYANETGVVVAVEQLDGETDFTAVVLTDVTNKEISVRTSQLRESAEVASGQDKLQGYELYDLVVLSGGGSANEVGVIVRVGREDFTVINNHGIVREIRPEELRGKRNSTSQRAVALDVQGNQIRASDSVNVVEGPHKGKTATIKRMSRAQLFLHSQTRTDHAGIFVVRSRSCVLAGTRTQARGATPDSGVSPFATPQSQSRGGPQPGRGKRDDGLIGKTVRIQAGQWKGYLGTVADATATHVQVELHSRLKKVMVVRERVAVAGDKFGATQEQNRMVDVNPNPIAPTTPFVAAGQTPMHGGATPMHGGALDGDTSDEVWQPGGAVDQDAVKDDDGWGSTANDGFGSPKDGDSDGWGSTSDQPKGWGTYPAVKDNTVKKEVPSTNGNGVKREQAKREMEAELDTEETPGWYMERVCVQNKSKDKQGVIKEIDPATKAAVVEYEDQTFETLRASELAMVPPSEHDTVLVTGGNEIGLEGSLVCVDGSDAILKDANDEFKIVEISFLAKVKTI